MTTFFTFFTFCTLRDRCLQMARNPTLREATLPDPGKLARLSERRFPITGSLTPAARGYRHLIPY